MQKHRLYLLPCWKTRNPIPEELRKCEQRARTSKRDESPRTESHLGVWKWESEKHKKCGKPARGFRDHVASDGSLLGVAGKWSACGWPVLQLAHD